MGLGYQQRSPEAEAAKVASVPATAQGEGNAAVQGDLGLESAGAAGGSVGALLDAVGVLWSARVDGVDDVWSRATDGPEDSTLTLLASAASAAILVATTEITGPLIAAAVAGAGASTLLKEVLAGAAGELVDAAQDGVAGAITETVEQTLASGQPTVDGYFLGTKGGLRMESLSAMSAWRALGERLAAVDGGEAVLATLTRAIARTMVNAEGLQMQRSVVEWMNVLACAATGRTGEEGSDVGKAGSGRSLPDKLMGNSPEGIVHLYVRFGDASQTPELTSARVSGVNDALVGVLRAQGGTIADAGLSLFVAGVTASGSLELGKNERGTVTCRAEGGGDAWLRAWAAEHGIDEEGAAAGVIAAVGATPMSALVLEAE